MVLAIANTFGNILRRQHGFGPFSFSLDLEFWFPDDHLDFDLLVRASGRGLVRYTEHLEGNGDAFLRHTVSMESRASVVEPRFFRKGPATCLISS